MNLPIKHRYSLTWANNRVNELKNKHPRATEIVKKFFKLTDKNLALYLAIGDPMFPALRDIIHRTEVFIEIHGIHYTDEKYKSFLRERIKNFTGLGCKERLDRRLESIMLEEQVQKGDSTSEYPTWNQPSFLELDL